MFGKWGIYLLLGVVVLITYVSFSPAIHNSFINWDDNAYVFENKDIVKPLPEAIVWFFGPHYYIGNYVPLTMIVYAIEYSMAGMDAETFHTVNLLIHLLNLILVFWFTWLLSGKKPLVAAFVSLFFGIHPVHVESVAWVAELKDVLYTFFFLAGLIAYYQYLQVIDSSRESVKSNYSWLILAFVLFVLSTLSKPAAVTFPVVLLLLDFYTQRQFSKRLLIEKLPFFIVAVTIGIITINAQHADNLMHDYYTLSQRLFCASYAFINYFIKLLLPINLSIFYPYPPMVDGHLPYYYYLAPVIVIAMFYGVYRTLKFNRFIAFGFLFFVVNMILVLQVISEGDAIMADHYTYVSYIGLFFSIAMFLDWLYRSLKEKLPAFGPMIVSVGIILAMTCSYLTYARTQIWENDETIATDLLEKFPDDRLALNNMGFIVLMQGDYERAVKLFTKAVHDRPDYIMAYINLTNAYIALKDYDDAIRAVNKALTYEPTNHHLLNKKGKILFLQQQYSEAVKYYQQAMSLKKEDPDAYIYMSEYYFSQKDYDKQLTMLNAGLSYNPDNYILLNNKGYCLMGMGSYKEAVVYFKECLRVKPGYEVAEANLSNCLQAMNNSSSSKH